MSDNNNKDHKDENKTSEDHNKGKQGFASMDKDKQKDIASKGGQTTHKDENKK